MKLVRWTRFTWDLTKLPSMDVAVDSHYHIRPAARDEAKALRNVIMSAFSLDMDWADTLKTMHDRFTSEMEDVFDRKDSPGLVVTHGSRIIGASVLNSEPDSENHLISGPSILVEYRNRGLGSSLLYQSLQMLRDHGIDKARGVTKANVPAAKFIYRKFGSTGETYEYEPQLVES